MNWLADWKRRFAEGLNEASRNASLDSGWSPAVANACDHKQAALMCELLGRLSAQTATPADFFDRPQLVECIEAANFAVAMMQPK